MVWYFNPDDRPKIVYALGTGYNRLKRVKVNEVCRKLCDIGLWGKLYVLDAFAGIGVMTEIYSRYGDVYAIEKERKVYRELKKRFRNKKNVTVVYGDNLVVMNNLVKKGVRFNIIDLDPFYNCYHQIPIAVKLIEQGLIFITSGEIYSIRRGKGLKRYGEKLVGGDGVVKLPYVITNYVQRFTQKKVKLLECYIWENVIRLYLGIGECVIPDGIFSGNVILYNCNVLGGKVENIFENV